MKYILKREMLVCYEKVLIEEEKSQATIEKYMRDVRKFFQYVEEMGKKEGITKEIVLSYKRSLIEEYAPSSVNSMLASLNHFFTDYCGRHKKKENIVCIVFFRQYAEAESVSVN